MDTLIPEGIYPLKLQWSLHFQRVVPCVLNVPHRIAIEIHPANWAKQLEGCTAVGEQRFSNGIGESDLAFEELIVKLRGQSDMTIEYREERAISA